MRIGVLNAYHFDRDPNSYRAQYRPMCVAYLQQAMPDAEIEVYEVGQDQWPPHIKACDVWVITGSSKSAYDTDPWILRLLDFVRDCHQAQQKLIGICFGHQVVAQALGGKVEKSPNGWGVGVRETNITRQLEYMQPHLDKCSLLYSHQDQVVKLPPDAICLATDDFCKHQMFSIGQHIFCLQGHPEFSVEFARSRVEARKDLIGPEKYKAAIASFSNPTHHKQVGEWMLRYAVPFSVSGV